MSWGGYDNLNMPGEIWKQIPGYEGLYEISNLGRARSMPRVLLESRGHTRKYRSKILEGSMNEQGYRSVMLCKDFVQVLHAVARLVAKAFIPNPDDRAEVNHKNGNKLDNSMDNLEWSTHQENCIHRNAVLKKNIGEKHRLAKMTNEQVISMRKMREETGLSCRIIAERHGLKDAASIHGAIRGRTWKHI